jgi:hypothetical protein
MVPRRSPRTTSRLRDRMLGPRSRSHLCLFENHAIPSPEAWPSVPHDGRADPSRDRVPGRSSDAVLGRCTLPGSHAVRPDTDITLVFGFRDPGSFIVPPGRGLVHAPRTTGLSAAAMVRSDLDSPARPCCPTLTGSQQMTGSQRHDRSGSTSPHSPGGHAVLPDRTRGPASPQGAGPRRSWRTHMTAPDHRRGRHPRPYRTAPRSPDGPEAAAG